MAVTILGYFLIPIGVLFLLVRPKFLLPCTVIFSGFSGSAVFLVGDLGIQPSYWFAILWFASVAIKGIKIEEIKKSFQKNIYLSIFVIYATFSILLPLILENNILVMNIDGKITWLTFTKSCITQLIYLWFSYISFLFFSVYFSGTKSRINDFISYYLVGASLVCIVCFYQIICFRTGMPFDELFRQNLHGNVQGARVYGPCIEASMLCYYLVTVLPLSIRRKRWWSFVLLIATIGLGIYSFSSTFIVGLGVWIILEFIHALKIGKLKLSSKKIMMILTGYISTIIVLLVCGDHVIYALEKLLITISQKNMSGIQRSYSFELLIDAFMKSPVLGIGFGTCRGNDLFSTWLAEVGFVGIGLLIIYFSEKLFVKNATWKFKVAIILVWLVMLISVPEPYNLFIWFLLSILDADQDYRIRKVESYEEI